MRVARLLTLAVSLLVVPVQAANAAPVTVGDAVTLTRGIGSWGAHELLMSVNGGATSFITFSLQLGEAISFSDTLLVGGINTYAMVDSASRGGDASGLDPISTQTAWLYTQFRHNALAGYDHSATSANRLQEAIWFFENEIAGQASNPFVLLANQAVQAGVTGIGNVRAANLFFEDGRRAQDQLILQVPGPAALTLLVPGLVLALSRRRRR